RNSGVEIIEGRGVLVDPHTIDVGGRRYTAENILVATGGHPTVPNIPGIEHVISSNEALDLPTLPRKIVIVGGGYIAVEFAGIFRGFGSDVVEIIRREELLHGFDDDLRVALAQELRGRGIEIHARTQVARIEKAPREGYSVFTTIGQEISADLVMYATGRAPNTKGLGLDAVGVSEEQARRQYGDDVDIYCARFKPMKNTLSGRDERTFMKLVVDGKTDRVLGCHMIGVDAPEIIQGLAIAVKCGASKRMFDQTVGLHPSAAEEFVTMREKFVRP